MFVRRLHVFDTFRMREHKLRVRSYRVYAACRDMGVNVRFIVLGQCGLRRMGKVN